MQDPQWIWMPEVVSLSLRSNAESYQEVVKDIPTRGLDCGILSIGSSLRLLLDRLDLSLEVCSSQGWFDTPIWFDVSRACQ